MPFWCELDERAKPIADGDKVVPEPVFFTNMTIVVGLVPADLWKPFYS